MPSLEMIYRIIAQDGASPAFRTVGAEAQALSKVMAEADAKMALSSKATADEIRKSMLGITEAERVAKVEAKTMSAEIAASMASMAEASKLAAAKTAEADAAIAKGQTDLAAKTEASSVARKKSMMNFGAASAAILVGIGYESVKAATTFEASMARVQTMAGAGADELKKMSVSILDLAPKVGVGPDALAESLYHVESAGFRGSKALDMVTASAKLSALGQDDINSSTQAVVATMASNIKGVRDANDAAALILHTVGTGDMTMHQFTQALGTGILATASTVGLAFKDIGAAIATLTDNAIPADQAATKLRTSLLMMVNPSGPASDALKSINMNSTQLAMDLQKPDGLKTAHGEAFIPLNPAKRDRSLDIWHRTGELLGAFADGGINFADRASAPIVEGLNRFEQLAIETVSRLASRTMKQVQGAYNAQTFGGASSNDILKYAMQYVGQTPYVWGGTTPAGWDCSGFTSWVYNHFGIGAPRTSEAQQGWARPSGETPGALAFFGNPAHHVGIALGGRKMVNAEHPGSLTMVDNLWSDFTGFGLPPQGLGAAGAVAGGFGGSTNEAVYQALKLNGLPASLAGVVLRQIMTESGGNANAVQGIVDVNSGNGGANLARGIMQVIPSTFAAFHMAGTSSNIFDKLANIAAGVNYAKNRYGPGLGFLGQGHGYDRGGLLMPGVTTAVNLTGKPEAVPTNDQWSHIKSLANGGRSGPLVHIDNVNSTVDLDLFARQAEFRERAGHFG